MIAADKPTADSGLGSCRAAGRASDDVEVWSVDLEAAGPALAALERETPRLSEAERAYTQSFTNAQLVSERQAAYIALRILIERAAGVQWRGVAMARTAHGKPHLAGASFGFSLSHVAGLALIGLSRAGAIGVDVERVRAVHVGRERRVLIEAAATAVAAREPPLSGAGDAPFLQAWVRLEALAKAHGCGIGRLLTRLGIVGARAGGLDEVERRAADVLAEGPALAVRDLVPGDGLFAAVAAAPGLGPGKLPVRRLPESVCGLAELLGEGTAEGA